MANYKSKDEIRTGNKSKEELRKELRAKNKAQFQNLMAMPSIQERFIGILNKNASGFMTALMTIFNDSGKLQECEPKSIIAAAGQAAILKLPIIPTLGYAYIVPFWDSSNQKYVAQFQLGHKGLIQLAMRSGQYRTLHSGKVFEGQIRGVDFLTGRIKTGEQTSDEVIGYVAHMELINGFEKTLYMTKLEIEEHAKEYSQSYKSDLEKGWKSSPWTKNFDAMAEKTVLKKLLTRYAPTSIDLESSMLATALKADQSEIRKNSFAYIDNGGAVVTRDSIDSGETVFEPAQIPAETDSELTNNPFDGELVDVETGEILKSNEQVQG